jgi:hypothetical protein
LTVLALGRGYQRDDAVAQSDGHVIALAHRDHHRVGLDRGHREAVAVRDRHLVFAKGDPKRGVGAGVDDADPHACTWLATQGDRRVGGLAVDQIVGVVDIAGPSQDGRLHLATHATHATHAT